MFATSPTRTVAESGWATGGWMRAGRGISTTVMVPVDDASPFETVYPKDTGPSSGAVRVTRTVCWSSTLAWTPLPRPGPSSAVTRSTPPAGRCRSP